MSGTVCWIAFNAFCESQKVVIAVSLSFDSLDHSSASKTSLFFPKNTLCSFHWLRILSLQQRAAPTLLWSSLDPSQSFATFFGFFNCVLWGLYNNLSLRFRLLNGGGRGFSFFLRIWIIASIVHSSSEPSLLSPQHTTRTPSCPISTSFLASLQSRSCITYRSPCYIVISYPACSRRV